MAVTDLSEQECRIVEIEAAAPRDPALFGVLLDEVLDRLTTGEPDPIRSLWIAGEVVLGTPWAGFRSGRARLATAAAAYLNWFAPPTTWNRTSVATVGRRRPLGWVSPQGDLVVDVLVEGEREVTKLGRAVARTRTDAMAVRVIDVIAPMRSSVFTPGAARIAISESEWNFGGRAR